MTIFANSDDNKENIMNEGQNVDLGLLAAKIAALRDKRVRMLVGTTSLVYNAVQIAKFKNMISEFSQICDCLICNARFKGYYTQQENDLIQQCQAEIEFCNQQLSKHGTQSFMDGISLLMEGLNSLNKRKN